jgi:hypothetical protein
MTGYTIPSEAVHGPLAGRPMLRWREDIRGAREDMARGIALAMTSARILAVRRPTAQQVTGDYRIALEEREPVHAIITAAYDELYAAITALEAARQAVDTAHRMLGYIPAEWMRHNTLDWSERPDLWGCTAEDVARADRARAHGIFATDVTTGLTGGA